MRAIQQTVLGGPEVLELREVPTPEPATGEVRVRVAAAGVHAVDTNIRRGDAPPGFPVTLPMVPGREVAGVVDAVGEGVDPSLAGTQVVVHLGMRGGGYAEFAIADAAALHPLPAGVSPAEAVAAIGTGRTAQLVLQTARLEPDDIVIIPGVSGGLGSQLAQLALARGCRLVTLYGGERKRAAAEQVGAKGDDRYLALDSMDDDWPAAMARWLGEEQPSLLLDGVGGDTARRALESLGRGGRVIIVGWASGTPVVVTTADILERSLTVASALGKPITNMRELESRALDAVVSGQVRPLIDAYPLSQAPIAHAAIERRESRGKVVLIPDGVSS